MTPEQRKLARHALGLPNKTNRSTRNHTRVFMEGDSAREWRAMVSAGLAVYSDQLPLYCHSIFHLTRAGALLALDEGESLNSEEFPEGGE